MQSAVGGCRAAAMGLFSKKKPEAPEVVFEGGVALLGRIAMVHGLQAKPELNGRPGKLINWCPADPCDPEAKHRFEVELDGMGKFKLKQSNLKMLGDEDVLGKRVQIGGLAGRSDLNGSIAQVLRWLEDKERFEVSVKDGSETVHVKPANISLPGQAQAKKK